jgi:hypothetical protein
MCVSFLAGENFPDRNRARFLLVFTCVFRFVFEESALAQPPCDASFVEAHGCAMLAFTPKLKPAQSLQVSIGGRKGSARLNNDGLLGWQERSDPMEFETAGNDGAPQMEGRSTPVGLLISAKNENACRLLWGISIPCRAPRCIQ